MSSRVLTPYEKNFLVKHGLNPNLTDLQNTDIPIEYYVKKANFRGLTFFVNESNLIPRIETEQLVDLAVENIKTNFSKNNKIAIADLCTGSGCIGIALAKELIKEGYNFHLYFSDISPQALIVAQKNYAFHLSNYLSHATFIESDLFNNFPKNTFLDLVLSNPPYVPSKRINKLETSVKNYEPILALDGGPDGLTFINKIILSLPEIQNDKVNAIIEVDSDHKLSQIKISEEINSSLIKDCFQRNRFLSLFSL